MPQPPNSSMEQLEDNISVWKTSQQRNNKGERGLSRDWAFLTMLTCLQSTGPPCCCSSARPVTEWALSQVKTLGAQIFQGALLFPSYFSKRLFSKISQVFQLTLARVFISVQSEAHIKTWQLNSLPKVLQRSFQGKL